jgi:hypothetical protein
MKGKVLIFLLMVLWMLTIFSLGANFFQDQQNFRFRIGRLILDFADNGSANVIIDDYGLGYVLFNEYSYGNNGQISFFLPFGQGKGIFSIGAFVDGWEVSERFASIDAFMITTFRFNFDVPEDIPLEAVIPDSIGFVLFLEGRTNAWAHGALPVGYPGYASASGSFTTELISASAYISAFFPNSPPYFDVYDYDPEQGYKRDAVIKTVDITSGQGEYVVEFSGSAATMNFNAMSVGSAYVRTGIVVLSGVDPLGIPEVGDNEFVWSKGEPPWLWIPALAKVVTGFTPDDYTMQWLAEKIDWHVSPSLPSTGLYVRMYPNGYENTFIFPRNRFEDANYEEPRFRYFLIFDMPEFLPATIDGGFGKRQLIMTFNGQPVHAANIEIFFPATATNHPFLFGDKGSGNPPDEGDYFDFVFGRPLWAAKSPNWFYYYWMVAYWGRTDIRLAVNVPGGWYEDGKPYVYVGNDAYLTYSMRLFHIENRSNAFGIIKPLITFADTLTIKGIHTFIYTVEHELAHKHHYETGIYPSTDPLTDSDGDRLNDYWEEGHFLDPNTRDTADAYNRFGDPTPGDLQCIADIEAYGKLLQKEELWRKDWADTGLQKGSPPPSDKFPWVYGSTNKNYSIYKDLLNAIP